ncbi:MAG: septum formation inhibitor Maf [Tissierellia bacterium]|nr:septum formation inhibitor Maf [Tissierellia bacterium]
MVKIVLASSSPRRKELLLKYNIDPIIVKANIKEKTYEEEKPEQVVMALAFEKANDVAKRFNNGEIVLGADTVVACEGKILGKPEDEYDGIRMIEFLNNREHEVITGICLIKAGTNIKIIDYEKTIVKFRNLSDKKIKKYIETGEYIDKAGAYGIQGFGSLLIEYIHGCYFNVVGLPVSKLDFLLEKHFNMSLL